MEVINAVMHQGQDHRFGYDFDTLARVLERVGFRHPRRCRFRDGIASEVCIDRAVHARESLYVEAQTPRS